MKNATSLTPPSTGLGDIQFSMLNVLESLVSKDQKKYNTEMKSGRLFTAATQQQRNIIHYKFLLTYDKLSVRIETCTSDKGIQFNIITIINKKKKNKKK